MKSPWKRRSEAAEEIQAHIAERTDELVDSGLPLHEARQQALREFGNVTQLTEASREVWGWLWIDQLIQDIRYAWRQLAMRPWWTAACVLSLALGIGVNAAVFSFVKAVLLDPFPYRDSQHLAILWDTKTATTTRGLFPEDVQQWRDLSSAIEGVSQFLQVDFAIGAGDTETVHSARIDSNLFKVLGAEPSAGRTFDVSDDTASAIAVVSFGFAMNHFGSSANAIGKMILVDGQPFTIVGAMQPAFFFPDYGVGLWVPWGNMKGIQAPAVARLKASFTLAEARAQLHSISTQMRLSHGGPEYANIPGAIPLYDSVVADSATALWLMLAAVALVLLIACANMTNLLMARGVEREKEIAIRATIGASRRRIVAQLLSESLLLSAMAGASGLLLAYWGVRALSYLNLAQIPRLDHAAINPEVLTFTVIVSVLTGLIFGLSPAIRLSRPNLAESVKQGGSTSGQSGRSESRALLVVAEIAIALTLLIGAGLILNSFVRLATANWGIDSKNVAVVVVRFGGGSSSIERYIQDIQDAQTAVRRLPGVLSVAVGSGVPVKWGTWEPTFIDSNNGRADVGNFTVGPGYFHTLGVPMIRGREFNESDTASSAKVAVISQALAEKLWPHQDPIGQQVTILKVKDSVMKQIQGKKGFGRQYLALVHDPSSTEPAEMAPRRVIGVVSNFRLFPLDSDSQVQFIYVNYPQARGSGPVLFAHPTFVVRTKDDPARQMSLFKEQIQSAMPGQVIYSATTMSDILTQSIGGRGSAKLLTAISAMFGILTLALVTMGVYGVVSHSVSRRTYETGVRMAMGATRKDILALMLRDSLRACIFGMALGLSGAWALTRLLKDYLFEITPTDVPTFAGVTLGLFLIATVAALIPALRATKVDPLVALRQD